MDRNQLIGSVRTVALSINKVERKGAVAIEDSVLLIGDIIKARRDLNLPVTFSAAAISNAAAAMQSFAQGMVHLDACHKELASDQGKLGFETRGEGDNCPWLRDANDPTEGTVVPLHVVRAAG